MRRKEEAIGHEFHDNKLCGGEEEVSEGVKRNGEKKGNLNLGFPLTMNWSLCKVYDLLPEEANGFDSGSEGSSQPFHSSSNKKECIFFSLSLSLCFRKEKENRKNQHLNKIISLMKLVFLTVLFF